MWALIVLVFGGCCIVWVLLYYLGWCVLYIYYFILFYLLEWCGVLCGVVNLVCYSGVRFMSLCWCFGWLVVLYLLYYLLAVYF